MNSFKSFKSCSVVSSSQSEENKNGQRRSKKLIRFSSMRPAKSMAPKNRIRSIAKIKSILERS